MERREPDRRRDLTAEEVEALVAEQSRPENLPPWWFDDFKNTSGNVGRVKFMSKPKYRGRKKR
jgi:hypothetical protein